MSFVYFYKLYLTYYIDLLHVFLTLLKYAWEYLYTVLFFDQEFSSHA